MFQRVDTGSACFDERRVDTGLNHVVRVSNHMQNKRKSWRNEEANIKIEVEMEISTETED